MGIPGFVAYLYKNHKNKNFIFKQLLKKNLDGKIDSIQHLLIDANCLIHPQARLVCQNNPNLVESNLDLLEKKIVKQVINYIETLINETKPTGSIYIAVDGVAPMAKIKHQRLRRFKSVYDRKVNESIAKNHNKVLPKEWNTSAITPGTIFMDKLMKSILLWIKLTKFDCKVIFSSSYTPGEGEHKLLQYLKKIDLKQNDNTVIYGLDADLLFLSLASKKDNIYLMRETSQMEIDGSKFDAGFSYLSIDILKDIIKDEMTPRLKINKDLNIKNIIDDFVFLCYFCGNDFLPTIPTLNIKPQNKKIPNGIDTIIDAYSAVIININNNNNKDINYLININDGKINLNYDLFVKVLDVLSEQEDAYFQDMFRNRRYIRNTYSKDPYEIEKYNYEENIINNYYDPIQLGCDDATNVSSKDPKHNLNTWKKKYYKHYFGNDKLNNILDEYVKGLVWTTHYYYNKCKDYEWFYNHHHGPFISDLRDYIKSNKNRLEHYEYIYNSDSIWFEKEIRPLQQLMLVLPHESSYLIPVSYRNLMFSYKLNNYFPMKILDIKMDYLYKSRAWQNIPMINIIPARTVLNLTSKVILKEEAERNKMYNEYVKN